MASYFRYFGRLREQFVHLRDVWDRIDFSSFRKRDGVAVLGGVALYGINTISILQSYVFCYQLYRLRKKEDEEEQKHALFIQGLRTMAQSLKSSCGRDPSEAEFLPRFNNGESIQDMFLRALAEAEARKASGAAESLMERRHSGDRTVAVATEAAVVGALALGERFSFGGEEYEEEEGDPESLSQELSALASAAAAAAAAVLPDRTARGGGQAGQAGAAPGSDMGQASSSGKEPALVVRAMERLGQIFWEVAEAVVGQSMADRALGRMREAAAGISVDEARRRCEDLALRCGQDRSSFSRALWDWFSTGVLGARVRPSGEAGEGGEAPPDLVDFAGDLAEIFQGPPGGGGAASDMATADGMMD